MESTSDHQFVSNELLNESKAFARTLLPELKSTPLYFINRPADFPHKEGLLGFTYSGYLTHTLMQSIDFRGDGVCIVFCAAQDRIGVLGTTIHELAHGPVFANAPIGEPTPARLAFQSMLINLHLSLPTGTRANMPVWYREHGLAFVRRCLHLHWRSWQAGFEVGLPDIAFCGPTYNLSPAYRYMHVLGDEPEQMRGATMAEIDAAKAPPKFASLFAQDFIYWLRNERSAQQGSSPPQEKETDVSIA